MTLINRLTSNSIGRANRPEPSSDQAVARQRIPIGRLAEAARRSASSTELARALQVDDSLLRLRVAHLHPAERAHLVRSLRPA